MVWTVGNISAQSSLKLILMFTVPESSGICEHKSELECTLSTDIPDGSYRNETYHGAEKNPNHMLEYFSVMKNLHENFVSNPS